MTSAPLLFRNAAASKVLTPVLLRKLSVSMSIPAYMASASVGLSFIFSSMYWSISAIISHADDANGSIYDSVAFAMTSFVCLW